MGMKQSVTCGYCHRPARLKFGNDIYPHRPDLIGKRFWKCDPCNAYVGCHPGTIKPLGRLANADLRRAKQCVHVLLDPMWKSKQMSRHEAYKWLADALGISAANCHIGMFDIVQCEAAISMLRLRRT